jgi:predicted ATPase/DNA-binding SARP family transcriptional activator
VAASAGAGMPPRHGLFAGLLGPPALWRDGEPLELGTPQQQRVLAALLLRRNQMVNTDTLVQALWPDAPPANPVQTVRTYLSRLRAGLGDALASESGGYVLRLAEGELDVDLFEGFAAAGRAALDDGSPAEAEARLRDALALVRSRPLAGMEYDDFCRHEAERLEELELLVREDLVEARLALGEHRELVAELRAAVGEQPLRERLWAQLMLALYRSDRQADALEAFRQARDLLTERLGLEPSRELRELERLILLQQRTLDHEEVGRMRGVPSYATSLVDRERELAAIPDNLAGSRLVSLVGPAGTGKTRLAAEAADRLRSAFPDGVWWIDLAAVDADGVGPAFGRALRLPEPPGRSAEELVVARLRGTRILLVVDNCEHVAAAAAALAERILAGTAAVRILATSREPLRAPGEAVLAVPPLATPAGERLFVDRAGGALPAGHEEAAVTRIVERLDGLPLAIELAAGRLRSLPLPDLAERLEHQLDLLSDGARTAPPRQRTLEAAIDWSYALLDAGERRALLALAAFPSDFDAAAAEAVVGDRGALLLVSRLLDKSLVALEPGEPSRYRLLQTVRSFLLVAAEAADVLDAARERHRAHFAAWAELLFRGLLEPEVALWLDRGHVEYRNVRAALLWSLERGEGDDALQIASAVGLYWFRTSRLNEGRSLVRRALELAPPESPWRPRGLVSLSWLELAAAAPEAGESAAAAVAACERADPELLAFAHAGHAQVQAATGRLDDAERSIERAGALFEDLAHPEGLHLTDELRGIVCFRSGDLDGALRYLTRSRDGYLEMRGSPQAGWAHIPLAHVQLALDLLAEAEASARGAIDEFQSRQDPRGLAAAYTCLGRARALRGDLDHARPLLEEAAALARRWGYGTEAAEAEAALAVQAGPAPR